MVLGLPMVAFGQTKEERERIASFSNKEGNTKLALELKQEDDQRKLRLSNYLAANPFVKKVIKDDESGRLEIMDVLPNGELIYAKIDNAGAATTARATALYSGGSLGLNIQGQGMTPAIWDGGNVRDTHQEFMVSGVSKVLNMDGVVTSDHATHVAGTVVAQGVSASSRGLAFNAALKSYDWTDDLNEMLNEAQTGLLVSNHSYGMGNLGSVWFYGAYDSRAKSIDNICFNNPFYLPVVSAGNDRGSLDPPASTQNSAKLGYDLIFGHGNAKNVITVAAVNEVSSYVDESSVTMSSFSSWGPSDDGRVKPDISMKGVAVRSTLHNSDTSYGFKQGTSMASPGITGVVTLLQQYYNQLYSNFMKAATVKGIILHTADEAGDFPGPDYKFGWGLVNADKSAKLIRDKNLTTSRSILEENVLSNGSTFTKVISASGSQPLKVSISWTDPAAPLQNNGSTDPTTKYLVNDLDLKVVSSTGTTYYPWKLQGMSAPYDLATNSSTNDIDNFEKVEIANPVGTYTIYVTHKGSLAMPSGSQSYSLLATSDNMSTLSVDGFVKNDEVRVFPNPAVNKLNFTNGKNGAKVTILDFSGRIVKQETLKNTEIQIENLVPGEYLALYKDKEGNEIGVKFIKK